MERFTDSAQPSLRFKLFTIFSVVLTGIVVLGQIFRYPGGVRDLVTGAFPGGVNLHYPRYYLFFAPFLHAADHLTILSLHQHIAFIIFVNGVWILSRWFLIKDQILDWKRRLAESGKILLADFFYAAILFAIVFFPRPMARLEADDPDLLIFNTHSHTSYSWDARKSFTPLKNLLWHQKGGFHANFITDHNVFDGVLESKTLPQNFSIVAMAGEEVSLFQSHWALLGNNAIVPNSRYDVGADGIRLFLRDVRNSQGQAAIASLPEYWLYHWDHLEDFARWGVDGFEIANSVPVALDFPSRLRSSVVDLCRKNNLVMVGVTDNHGWGSAVYCWNVIRVPGWRALPETQVQPAVLGVMGKDGFSAVRVIVRVKSEPPDHASGLILDPFLQVWECARSLPLPHAASALVWVWVLWAFAFFKRKRNV